MKFSIMKEHADLEDTILGVVGLGLMGSSIVAALLIAGHRVKAIAPISSDAQEAQSRIHNQLKQCTEAGLIAREPEYYMSHLIISEDYEILHDCSIVMECVIEKIEIKSAVYARITSVVKPETIITSNTSAIPISVLQERVENPGRFLGIHWAEPAIMTRFLEITCGRLTTLDNASYIWTLAHRWGKEPTLLKKDIRGFITNRLMYAVYRETFHLMENGKATHEDFDKSFRYDAGSWMTFMGIFRRMDYMGLNDFATILNNLLPELSNSGEVPAMMQQTVMNMSRGVHNSDGLYPYTDEEAAQWRDAFLNFNNHIPELAAEYSVEKVREYTTAQESENAVVKEETRTVKL